MSGERERLNKGEASLPVRGNLQPTAAITIINRASVAADGRTTPRASRRHRRHSRCLRGVTGVTTLCLRDVTYVSGDTSGRESADVVVLHQMTSLGVQMRHVSRHLKAVMSRCVTSCHHITTDDDGRDVVKTG